MWREVWSCDGGVWSGDEGGVVKWRKVWSCDGGVVMWRGCGHVMEEWLCEGRCGRVIRAVVLPNSHPGTAVT